MLPATCSRPAYCSARRTLTCLLCTDVHKWCAPTRSSLMTGRNPSANTPQSPLTCPGLSCLTSCLSLRVFCISAYRPRSVELHIDHQRTRRGLVAQCGLYLHTAAAPVRRIPEPHAGQGAPPLTHDSPAPAPAPAAAPIIAGLTCHLVYFVLAVASRLVPPGLHPGRPRFQHLLRLPRRLRDVIHPHTNHDLPLHPRTSR